MRQITSEDIEPLALGATLLGTGGGGDPHIGALMAKQAIDEFGPVTVVEPDALPPDGLVAAVAVVGRPRSSSNGCPRAASSSRRCAR